MWSDKCTNQNRKLIKGFLAELNLNVLNCKPSEPTFTKNAYNPRTKTIELRTSCIDLTLTNSTDIYCNSSWNLRKVLETEHKAIILNVKMNQPVELVNQIKSTT